MFFTSESTKTWFKDLPTRQKIFLHQYDIIYKSFCPENSSICNNFLPNTIDEADHAQYLLLKNNIIHLYLTGNNDASQVCASLLSKCLPQKDIAPSVNLYFTNKIDPQVSHVKVSRMSFGKQKFKASKKLFGELAIGRQVPSKPYSFRVAPKSIATSIEYLQAQLPMG